jgi:hypothetical protein
MIVALIAEHAAGPIGSTFEMQYQCTFGAGAAQCSAKQDGGALFLQNVVIGLLAVMRSHSGSCQVSRTRLMRGQVGVGHALFAPAGLVMAVCAARWLGGGAAVAACGRVAEGILWVCCCCLCSRCVWLLLESLVCVSCAAGN